MPATAAVTPVTAIPIGPSTLGISFTTLLTLFTVLIAVVPKSVTFLTANAVAIAFPIGTMSSTRSSMFLETHSMPSFTFGISFCANGCSTSVSACRFKAVSCDMTSSYLTSFSCPIASVVLLISV